MFLFRIVGIYLGIMFFMAGCVYMLFNIFTLGLSISEKTVLSLSAGLFGAIPMTILAALIIEKGDEISNMFANMRIVFKNNDKYIKYMNFREVNGLYLVISVKYTDNLQDARIYKRDDFKNIGLDIFIKTLEEKYNQKFEVVKVKLVEV